MKLTRTDKTILLGVLASVVVWVLLYYFFVHSLRVERDAVLADAEKQLGSVEKSIAKSDKTIPKPKADAVVKEEMQALDEELRGLAHIELADRRGLRPLGEFSVKAAGGADPNNYFFRKRRDVLDAIQKGAGVRLSAALVEDLGFRDQTARDSVELNLVRLYALSRLMEAAKAAAIQEILAIQYPVPRALPRYPPPGSTSSEEEMDIERLIQVPLVLRLRAGERDFAHFLAELQPDPNEPRFKGKPDQYRYFCIRWLKVEAKDAKTGVLEATVAVGALFPDSRLVENKIEVKSEEKDSWDRVRFPRQGPQY